MATPSCACSCAASLLSMAACSSICGLPHVFGHKLEAESAEHLLAGLIRRGLGRARIHCEGKAIEAGHALHPPLRIPRYRLLYDLEQILP